MRVCGRDVAVIAAILMLLPAFGGAQKSYFQPLDRQGERWVKTTLAKMSLDDKVGQLMVSSFGSDFVSTDSDQFDKLATIVRDHHVGGFHVFGGVEAAPDVLLNPTYGTVTLGQPLAAASLLNRLQALAQYPLLNS